MFGPTTRSGKTRTIVALFRNSHLVSRPVHQINLTSIEFGSDFEQRHRPPVVHVDDRARCRITTVDDRLGARNASYEGCAKSARCHEDRRGLFGALCASEGLRG
jgi:hypothetical protein